MATLKNNTIQQCGVCGRLTNDGHNIPSTNAHPVTKIVEHANFICRYCDCERRNLNLINKAADERLKRA